MSILVIPTGGTIGAMPYKDIKRPARIQTMPPKGQDFVRAALQKIPDIKTRYVSHENCDSNLIDDAYRQGVLDIITKSPESMVLITHGTDTLLATADFFHKRYSTQAALKDKTILLTGAMAPLSCGPESDGWLNLRFALRQLNQGQLSRGVHIVLCDYQDVDARTGWQPRLYRYKPGYYEKFFDPEDASRNRLKPVNP
jgi:L-asparaginase/Glu-tRNA(Gln) amidotransferase subunit D